MQPSEFVCENFQTFQVTDGMVEAFWENGYIVVRGLFADYVGKMNASCDEEGIQKTSYQISDGSGSKMNLALWNHPGHDFFGKMARSEPLVNGIEKLFKGEVYHYHSKLLMKEAEYGGAFEWHQDYGYWYSNGCLKPDMLTVFIAIDESKVENGCLQVLSGSHKLGRVNHAFLGGQNGADEERVKQVEQSGLFPRVYVTQKPGDALIFHSNVLHTSSKNKSKDKRYMLAVAYNKADNNPVYEHHHPQYTTLQKVSAQELHACDVLFDNKDKGYYHPSIDKTVPEYKNDT